MYRYIKLTTILLALLTIGGINAQSNSEYLFGKIETKSGEEYVGFMRWGTEELFWHDIFNSSKLNASTKNQAKNDNRSLWRDFDWNLSSLWEDKYRSTSHIFSCFFGDIQSLYPQSGNRVDLELKNGTFIKLSGGSNDIGAKIQLFDYELGMIKLSWSKIEKIEFFEAPENLENPFGKGIYGTLETKRKGSYTGYIKWDMDERVANDILDGKSKHGEQKIPFRNIAEIEKHESGVNVIFDSGREIYLTGTNDVNSGNRGIAIYQEGVGSLEVDWKEFERLVIHKDYKNGPSYRDFAVPIGLDAKVSTYKDRAYEGLIIFDVDERWEMEMLDGNDDNIAYQIPMRNIEKIIPKNSSYSLINLRNGVQLLLGEGQDVSSANDGVLLFSTSNEKPDVIEWDDIIEIRFK